MKTYNALVAFLFIFGTYQLHAIQQYDIRFVIADVDCQARKLCYEIQLRSANGQAWNLADQNYRIFYDASIAQHRSADSPKLLLPSTMYTSISMSADIGPIDAGGSGKLSFDSDLGFLNFSTILTNQSLGGINLPANGDWVSTVELCFNATAELISNPNACMHAVWGRMGLTDDYATAFVEVTQWLGANSTTSALPNRYHDLSAEDGERACITTLCDPDAPSPENTPALCSDGIDNDGDGLTDCEDPKCQQFAVCAPPEKRYDIRLELARVDCVTGQACYNVEIRGFNNSFNLGNQSYRLYYNSGVGTFVNATSLLGNNYTPLTLINGTPIENRDATGLGSLSYESTLGFLHFNIDLSNQAQGGARSIGSTNFVPAAEICFNMTPAAISSRDVCFDADWARSGVTTNYNQGVVTLNEYTGPNSSFALIPNSFGNLSRATGNKSCFDMSCGAREQGEGQCSDGIDNDNNGLIDCLDPGCSNAEVCRQNCNAQAPVITRN